MTTAPTPSERRRLLRAGGWLALVNVAAVAVIGLPYLWLYGVPSSWLAWLYVLLAYVGHAGALAFPPFVLLTLVALLAPRPRLLLVCAALVGGAGLSLLLLDSLVFAENRYHLSLITVGLLAPSTWAFFTLYFLVFAAVEAMLGLWIWRRSAAPPTRRVGRFVAVALMGSFVVSQLIHTWAEARYYVPVTSFAHYLPLYQPPNTTQLQVNLGLVDREHAREQGLVTGLGQAPVGALSYPLAPLRCTPPLPAYNVLLVVIDAMRADALTPAVAPRLSALAPSTIRFDAHYSGGNSSRAGMFSLFYGLPATYWAAFAAVARPPVLMDLFRQYGYQLGLFSSSPVYSGVGLDRTALAREPNLRLRTDPPDGAARHRDGTVTDEWIDWLERRDRARPFFGFLYFDAPQAKAPPDGYPAIVAPPPGATKQQRLEARYLTAVHYVDSLVGRVLDDLTRRGLDDRTVVIVTSDHGMEFGENGLGFTGHGTAYSAYQMRTPFLIRWPGRALARIERRTSHLDVAPTLVTELFGCTNLPADYSSGQNLFSGAEWTWLVAGSYSEFALLEPDQVTVVYSTTYEIRDASYHLVANPRLRRDVLRAALREMSRFYR